MVGDETLQQPHDESDSEAEEDAAEVIPKIDIDPSTLTPLSPEVISKQVNPCLLKCGRSLLIIMSVGHD